MKSLSTLVFAVVLRGLLAALALYAPSAAATVPGTLTLKALVQISEDEVTLADIIASPTGPGFPGALVICHAPDQGTLRMINMAEIAAVLKKHDLEYSLQGPQQINVMRTARRISVADLKPLIEATLLSADPKATVADIELQAAISVGSNPGFKLLKLRFDPAIQKYRAWFVVTSESRKTAFAATFTLERGTAPVEISVASAGPRALLLPVLIHRGQTAMMQLQGDGFSAMVPVLCLEDGRETTLVHVRDKASKRNYRAQVLARELVRAVSREN